MISPEDALEISTKAPTGISPEIMKKEEAIRFENL